MAPFKKGKWRRGWARRPPRWGGFRVPSSGRTFGLSEKSSCHAREARTLASGAIYDPQAKISRIPLYPRKKNPKTGKRRNLGTFATRSAAEKHERAVQFFKRK